MPVVFTNGVFDVIHYAHVELLKFCKTLAGPDGKVLVALNSDESVKRIKGPSRPVFSEQQRASVVSAFRVVDDVIIFSDDTPLNLIKTLKPDIIVKGGDYRICDVVGNDICEVVIFNYVEGCSTTKTIQRISDR